MLGAPDLPLPPGNPPSQFPLGIPVGCIIAYAGEVEGAASSPPPSHVLDIEAWGWMLCDGRQLRISEYPELFAALGFRYVKAGESKALPASPPEAAASAMFRIPDYRGYFLRGVDGGSGNDPDAAVRKLSDGETDAGVGSIQEDALQTHEHIYKSVPAPATPSDPGTAAGAPPSTPTLTEKGPTSSLSPPGDVKVSQYETRPENISINYIIKYR